MKISVRNLKHLIREASRRSNTVPPAGIHRPNLRPKSQAKSLKAFHNVVDRLFTDWKWSSYEKFVNGLSSNVIDVTRLSRDEQLDVMHDAHAIGEMIRASLNTKSKNKREKLRADAHNMLDEFWSTYVMAGMSDK